MPGLGHHLERIAALDDTSRMALLAHCVSYGVNALYERPNPHSGSGVSQFGLDCRLSGADRIARATGFDMVMDGGWRPTVDNYLGRVTKPASSKPFAKALASAPPSSSAI